MRKVQHSELSVFLDGGDIVSSRRILGRRKTIDVTATPAFRDPSIGRRLRHASKRAFVSYSRRIGQVLSARGETQVLAPIIQGIVYANMIHVDAWGRIHDNAVHVKHDMPARAVYDLVSCGRSVDFLFLLAHHATSPGSAADFQVIAAIDQCDTAVRQFDF
jgi:hypothetical protein